MGPNSAIVSVNLGVTPAAPSGLTGTSGTAGTPFTVNLAWTDNSNNNASFQIQRCTGTAATCGAGANWTNVSTTVGANATTFVATTPNAVSYRFRIRAVNPQGNSAYTYTPNGVLAQ